MNISFPSEIRDFTPIKERKKDDILLLTNKHTIRSHVSCVGSRDVTFANRAIMYHHQLGHASPEHLQELIK